MRNHVLARPMFVELFVGIAAFLTGAVSLSAADPNAPLATLRKEHPRLIATSERFDELREQIRRDEVLGFWHGDLKRNAERIIRSAPSKYEIPDGKRLLSTSRRVLDRVYTLALLYRLDGDARYVDRAWKELEAAAQFKDWNPSHFLDTAEMTHAFAIGYDWLFDRWTDGQRAVLRGAMIEKGLKPALDCYRGKARFGWWVRSQHNWNQVCNGGIVIGALAIADEEPDVSREILTEALESLPLAMQHFAPDGAWAEGLGYWRYATQYNVAVLAAMDSALGTDFGLSETPGFARAADFPIALAGASQKTFNFADASASTVRAPQLFWFARKFDLPTAAAYQRAVARPEPLDLVWYVPADRKCAPVWQRDHYFRTAEVVTMRSEADDSNALFVAAKGGDNRVNHGHLDLGTFVLDALGQRWLLDLGADNYNLPGYFGSRRWDYYRLRAEAHNTLVINPSDGPDQDPSAKAKVVRFTGGGSTESPSAAIDLTAAYAAHAKRVERTIALERRREVVLVDRIECKKPADVWSFLHTMADVRLADDARSATLLLEDARLTIALEEPADARFAVMQAAPLPTSPNPEGQRSNGACHRLAVHLTNVTDTQIRIRFSPGSSSGR